MTYDATERIRKEIWESINSRPRTRDELEREYGRVWSTQELEEEFEVLGFLVPFVIVRVRATGLKGSLAFQHSPRLYFDFRPDVEG
jgi:hypothetical protein